MSLFKKILSDIQANFTQQENNNKHLITIINTLSGTVITTNNIKIKKGTLQLLVSPTVKMAILLKKDAILQEFKKQEISIGSIT